MPRKPRPAIEPVVLDENFNSGLDVGWRKHALANGIADTITHARERRALARAQQCILPGVVLRR